MSICLAIRLQSIRFGDDFFLEWTVVFSDVRNFEKTETVESFWGSWDKRW